MDKNLTLNLVRVTEIAAIKTSYEYGKGDKNAADQAAVDGMRKTFDEIDMTGTVVIGEGEMDEAPMLYIGEKVGKCKGGSIEVDIAVDPVDGTELIAKGLDNSISVLAVGPKGSLLHAPDMYMEKLVSGPEGVGVLNIDAPIEENVKNLAKALNKDVQDIVVAILERERHEDIINRVRKTGAKVKLFKAGDIVNAINTCFSESGTHMMAGIGGAPEGVIAAAAIKGLRGFFQARLKPYSEEEKERCKKMGIDDVNHILEMEDLVKGDEITFVATGVTNGDILRGVVKMSDGKMRTHSLAIRAKTGTVRFIDTIHCIDKAQKISCVRKV